MFFKIFFGEQIGLSGKASDFHSEGVLFEPEQAQRLQ
jgi:hypothetical protein